MTSTALAERDYWDAHAHDRSEVWGGDWEADVAPCLDAILPSLGLTDWANVLDLGCGPGRLSIPAAQSHRSWAVYGVDVSPAMLAEAEREAEVSAPNAVFRQGDGRTLPATLPPMDGAWSLVAFQHMPDDAVARYLREVARVLRPGGRFRFQFVVGQDAEFLHQKRNVIDVTTWCAQAGLTVTEVDLGAIYPEWCFVTAVRP